MQEKRQHSTHAALTERLSDIHKMVIVHPDEVAGSAVPGDRFGITLVYRLVRLPEGWFEVAEVLQIMKQRPDDLVGIAKVKLVAFCLAQRYRHDTVAYATGGFGERRLRDLARDPRPANPRPTAPTQHWP